MKTLSNTLTRWHKIADRIKLAATKTMEANVDFLRLGHNIDSDTLEVRGAAIAGGTTKAIGENTVLYLALHAALFDIRRALAHANVAHGVSDCLNAMEQTKQRADYYQALLDTTDGVISQAEFAAIAQKRSTRETIQRSQFHGSLTFLSNEQVADLTSKRDTARKEVNALADRLADKNATKIDIEFNDIVVNAIGL